MKNNYTTEDLLSLYEEKGVLARAAPSVNLSVASAAILNGLAEEAHFLVFLDWSF